MRRHSKNHTSAVNGSRSFSGHVPMSPHALWSTCVPSWLHFIVTIWNAGQEKEVVTTLIEEMYPYKNPKVLSIDKIIKPDNSTQLKTIKAPRKLTTRCLKVFYRTIQMIVIQQFVHSHSQILACPFLYLTTALKNCLHMKTIVMARNLALWI